MKKLLNIIFFLLIGVSTMFSQDLTGVKILVNPGHGGFDANDRNMVIFPFEAGDPKGFWESQSNLDKGLQLRDLLTSANATVIMSRSTNNPTVYQLDENGNIMKDENGNEIIISTDDTPLTQVVRMANEADVDFMLSIHSNAGVNNYVLQLYAGKDLDDTHVYPTPIPFSDESRAVATLFASNLYSNQANTWATGTTVVGDKTYGRTAMKWNDGYGVLRGLTVPGCLSEGSMHDYIPETYRLMNMEYKWLEAWHFFKSFSTYYEAGEIKTGNIAGTIHDSRNLNMASYFKIKKSKDELLPLHKAKVTIQPGDLEYTTDELYNGVYVFKQLQPGTYNVKVEAEGYYPTEETLTVNKNTTTYFNFMLNKVRDTPPEVISYSPDSPLEEPVACSSKIIMEFNWDMDVESVINAFSISPHIEGEFTFEDSQHRMIFTPNIPFDINTVYSVKLAGTAKHPANIEMGEDFEFQFKTKSRNRLIMLNNYPNAGNESVYYIKPTFTFYFDSELYTTTAADCINVYDKDGNALSKASRSLSFNKLPDPYGSISFQVTTDLKVGETYRIVVDGAIKDLEEIPLVTPLDYTFKAADIRITDKDIVQDFDGINLMKFDDIGSTHVTNASVTRTTSAKLFGTASYNFKYKFNSTSGGEAQYQFLADPTRVNSEEVIGAHIFGDLTGNEVYLQFQADEDVEFIKLTDLYFAGWEFVEASLEALTSGKTYQLTGVKLVQRESDITANGNFNMDNMLLYDEIISTIDEEIDSSIFIYPNPAYDKIFISGDPVLVEFYTLGGQKIMERVGEKEISVVGLKGMYIMKITDGQGKVTAMKISVN